MALRKLKLIDLLDVFVPGRIEGKVRIDASEPLVGVLLCDREGRWFLAPEEDERGGGMGSIRVHHLPGDAVRRCRDKVVKVTGIFEDGHGLTVSAIAPAGKSSD